MRKLSFAGFLKGYVRSLSLADTNNLFKLAKEAAERNPRLREPLFLYAFFTDKTDLLLRASCKYQFYDEFKRLMERYEKDSLENALRSDSAALPEGYKKVWRSYHNKRNRVYNDNHTKELMRIKALKLQTTKGVTNYRLYADLGLNPGNMNAWLKYGDPNKVSLDTARRTVSYLETK